MLQTNTNDIAGICSTYPEYKSMEIAGNKVKLTFTAWGALSPFEGITGFEIAGADRKFYPAEAKNAPFSSGLVVSSPKVAKPVAVRYCYQNWLLGNVVSQYGLPLVPFRTDDW